MTLNIAHKILAVALVVLVPMVVVAIYSIGLMREISYDLESVSRRQIPVTEAVARINVSILEQGIVLQRLFVEEAGSGDEGAAHERRHQRFETRGDEVAADFAQARALLMDDRKTGRHGRDAIDVLSVDLNAIEKAYLVFEAHGREMIEARGESDRVTFDALLANLNARQDAINVESDQLREHAEDLMQGAIDAADRDERYLLITNIVLTSLAVIMGLGIAVVITRLIVRAVRNLVDGAERVERGELDVHVRAESRDEIGSLTASFNHMVGGLRLKERIRETFGKYMDPRIVGNLLERPQIAEPGGEHRTMTVMFVDLKGFTTIAEALPADDLIGVMNRFFDLMTDAIADHGGVVDKFMGDAVMAYWGPPFNGENEHTALACRAAVEAMTQFETFRGRVLERLDGRQVDGELDVRIGISTGEMIVGTIGSKVSRSFTIMGDPVNLGSRLEGANKAYGTRAMISEETRHAAGDAVAVRELDLIRVKGKTVPTRVFELLAAPLGPIAARAFEDGIAAYRRRDWDAAESSFRRCLADMPDDTVSALYLDRIEHFRTAPPPNDWDGVWVFSSK